MFRLALGRDFNFLGIAGIPAGADLQVVIGRRSGGLHPGACRGGIDAAGIAKDDVVIPPVLPVVVAISAVLQMMHLGKAARFVPGGRPDWVLINAEHKRADDDQRGQDFYRVMVVTGRHIELTRPSRSSPNSWSCPRCSRTE